MGSDLGSDGDRGDRDRGRPGPSGPVVAETMRAAVSLRSPESSLQALIGLMIESGPWTAGSICLLTAGGRLETAAFLDARAAEGDRLQAEFGEGPSNDALRDEPVRWSVDLAGETRWTRWSPAVAALGFRSTLAVRLFTDTTLGTVNLYATRAGQLDPTDMCAAQVTAAHVSVVVAAISTERHLRRAMWSRNVIGQAQGMLMQRNGLTADQALEFLRRQSQQRNLKLVALAGQITGTGIPPIIDGPG